MPRSPEIALVARLYRAIPARLRQHLDELLPPERRRQVEESWAGSRLQPRVVQLGDRLHRVTNRQILETPDTVLALSGTARRAARVHPVALTPLEVRRQNLDAVRTALEQASIPYFAVRGRDDQKSVLGVDAQHREHAHEVLVELCRRTAGYLATIHDGQSRRKARLRPGAKSGPRPGDHPIALRLVWFRTDPGSSYVWGERYACEVEFWQQDGLGALTAPRANRVATEFSVDEPEVLVSDTLFTRLSSLAGEPLPPVTTVPTFAQPLPDDVLFPIDAVFTWVDGSDESWKQRRTRVGSTAYHEESDNESRYLSRDELKFALRSLDLYAPWIRTIYLVTDAQVPPWLDTDARGLRVVDHRDIFTDVGVLPTFNSHAIESQLHHIDGLSEQFLYLNDDMMLGSEVTPQTFFHSNGLSKFFPSRAKIPQGQPKESDPPVTIAAKNNRAILQPLFGTSPAQKMQHAPYALRRSVLAEMEERFPDQHRRTMAARIRSSSDLSLVSNFYHYYAFQTARAVPGRIRYRYVDLAEPDAGRVLAELSARRNQQAICVNSTAEESEPTTEQVLRALDDYFPLPSRFEKENDPECP